MLTVIQGPAGSGKTMWMSRLIKPQWDRGVSIYPNFPIWFDEQYTGINRWHVLDDTFHLEKGIICIDESQKLLDARRWRSLPMAFAEKIAEHRHDKIDIITTTQDMNDIDVRMRRNIHELYTCHSIFRFPKTQRVKPIFQIIIVNKKVKIPNSESNRIRWKKDGHDRIMFLSKYWTPTYYDSYGKTRSSEFLCRIKVKSSKTKSGKLEWKAKVFSTALVNQGRRRL